MGVEAQGVPLKASGDDQSSSFPSCLLSFVARATRATFLTEQPPLPLTPSQPTTTRPWPCPLATSLVESQRSPVPRKTGFCSNPMHPSNALLEVLPPRRRMRFQCARNRTAGLMRGRLSRLQPKKKIKRPPPRVVSYFPTIQHAA